MSPVINFSSLAKPFQKTDNSYRLPSDLPSTEKMPTRRKSSRVTNNNNAVKLVHHLPAVSDKKLFALTTGFSFRRNPNNTKVPYTLTFISKPLESYSTTTKKNIQANHENKKQNSQQLINVTEENLDISEAYNDYIKEDNDRINDKRSSSITIPRINASPDPYADKEASIYHKPTIQSSSIRPRTQVTTTPPITESTKYYLKTVLRRPAATGSIDNSTENSLNFQKSLEKNSFKAKKSEILNDNYRPISNANLYTSDNAESNDKYNEPVIFPYDAYSFNEQNSNVNKDVIPENNPFVIDTTSAIAVSNELTSTTSVNLVTSENPIEKKPSYYLYHVEDDAVADQTTEVFNVKNIIRNIINTLTSSTLRTDIRQSSTTPSPISTAPSIDEKVVHIGGFKKKNNFADQTPVKSNVKHLKIITEPSVYISPTAETIIFTGPNPEYKNDFVPTTTAMHVTEAPLVDSETQAGVLDILPSFDPLHRKGTYKSKFNSFVKGKVENEKSHKYHKVIDEEEPPYDTTTSSRKNQYTEESDLTQLTKDNSNTIITTTEDERLIDDFVDDIASTTSTTKSTTTSKTVLETKPTTKSISFPTRASRINPAIKLAVETLGGGRRSYQSSSKCSPDNSLQANSKCNKIKNQRYSPASSLCNLMFFHFYLLTVEASYSLLSASRYNWHVNGFFLKY